MDIPPFRFVTAYLYNNDHIDNDCSTSILKLKKTDKYTKYSHTKNMRCLIDCPAYLVIYSTSSYFLVTYTGLFIKSEKLGREDGFTIVVGVLHSRNLILSPTNFI